MTATIDSAFAAQADRIEIKRDHLGRYLLPDPTTGQERSWQRTTTFIKLLANQYNINKWRLRMAAMGLAARPDLLALASSILDPESKDGKNDLNNLVDQAIEAAGASTGANLGTALHQLTEAVDLGHDVVAPTPELQAKIDDYRSTLERHNLEIIDNYIECVILNTDFDVGGTADRFVRCPDGAVRVLDLKTSKTMDFGHAEFSMQLACYATAHGIYNGSDWDPMPADLDLSVGYVVHLPSQLDEPCVVYSADIDYGYRACVLAVDVREVQRRKDLLRPLLTAQQTTIATPPADDERRLAVLRRCRSLDVERKEQMRTQWPTDVPGLTGEHRHTDAELDAIESVLDLIDGSRVPAAVADELLNRMKALPGDLFLAVEATAKGEGVPHVERGWSEAHAERLEELTTAAENEQAERHMQRVKSLSVIDDEDTYVAVAAMANVPRIDLASSRLDDLAHERIMALAELYDVCGTLEPAAEVVIDHAGGKKQLSAAARAVAKRHGLDCPRSAAEVAEQPVLAALALTHQPHEKSNE